MLVAASLLVGCDGRRIGRPGRGEQFTILFTNDLGGHVVTDRSKRGGLARIATEVKKIRGQNPDAILIDAGDETTGTALATLTNGEAVFRVMNAVGYDASVYGNHEFDLGQDQAKKYQTIANFPLLACNILDKEGKPFTREFAILKMGKLRVGVIGVANPETTNLVDKTLSPDLRFLPPESEIRRIQQELAGKADLMMILSHQGLKQDISLAYKLIGIPLIVGGHSEVALSG